MHRLNRAHVLHMVEPGGKLTAGAGHNLVDGLPPW